MPKDKQAQEIINEATESIESNADSQEAPQEVQEVNEQTEEKGFFAKVADKAKQATSELFTGKDEQKEEAKTQTQTKPKLKSILKKGVKFASVTAFIYKGEGSFTLKIGAYPYIIQSGEVFVVPDDKTATYLRYKEQLFSEITD